MFLLLLALDYKRLSRFVVLVIDHITLIHVVDLFLVVRINYRVSELLLFPTAAPSTTGARWRRWARPAS
jgi:hypothetical protein